MADDISAANKDLSKEQGIEKVVKYTGFKKGVSGNPKGRPKNSSKVFSLRDDLIDSLRRLKSKSPKKYRDLIDSYWSDPKMRPFLMETIEGKATTRVEQVGSLANPIRTIEIKPMIHTDNLTVNMPSVPKIDTNT